MSTAGGELFQLPHRAGFHMLRGFRQVALEPLGGGVTRFSGLSRPEEKLAERGGKRDD